jgi:hypothetical protein
MPLDQSQRIQDEAQKPGCQVKMVVHHAGTSGNSPIGLAGVEAEAVDEFERHQAAGAAAVVGLDRLGGAGGDPGDCAVVVAVRRRGERAGRIVGRLLLSVILRMTMTVMKLIMALTGTGKGTGLMIGGMPGLATRRGRNRQSRRRREEGGRGHGSMASGVLVIGFGTRIPYRRAGKTIGRAGTGRIIVVPVVLWVAEGVEERGDVGLAGASGLMGLVGLTRPIGRRGMFIVLSIGGKAGVVGPIDRTVGWAMVLRLVGN